MKVRRDVLAVGLTGCLLVGLVLSFAPPQMDGVDLSGPSEVSTDELATYRAVMDSEASVESVTIRVRDPNGNETVLTAETDGTVREARSTGETAVDVARLRNTTRLRIHEGAADSGYGYDRSPDRVTLRLTLDYGAVPAGTYQLRVTVTTTDGEQIETGWLTVDVVADPDRSNQSVTSDSGPRADDGTA